MKVKALIPIKEGITFDHIKLIDGTCHQALIPIKEGITLDPRDSCIAKKS